MWKTTTGCLLASAATFMALAAHAQEAQPTQLAPIIVTDDAIETGEVVIDREQLEELNPVELGQVFDGQTAVSAGNALPVAQKVFVHGIEESQLNVSVDGARQNKGGFHHSGNVLIDPSLLRAVTVEPGVATADAGPQALAGAIAYETLDARDLLEDEATMGGRVRLTYSSNGDTFYGATTLYGRSEGFEYLLNYSGARGDEFEDGDGNIVEGTAAGLDSYMAKVAYTTETGKRIEFSADHTVDDEDRQTRPNFGGVVGSPIVLGPTKVDRTSYVFSYKDESPEGWLAPEVTLAYSSQGYRSTLIEGETTSYNGKVQNTFLLGNGTVTAGIDFFNDEAESGGSASGTETLKNLGLFAQARQDITDRLSISYGGRYDYQWFTGADDSKFTDGGLSGNVTLDYDVGGGFGVFAGASSVFGGYALGEAGVINFSGPWSYDGMETSRSNNARIGMKYASGGFDMNAAIYYTEIENAQEVNNADRSSAVDIESKGIDASFGYTYGSGAVRLNYTYADVTQDGETPSTTNDYFGIPVGHIFGLQAVHQINDEWTIGGTAEIALENDDTAGLVGGRGTTMYALPAYEVVNLYATYKPRQISNLEIRGEIQNLFDETYMKRTSNGGGQGDLIIPLNEPGRTFLITATLTF